MGTTQVASIPEAKIVRREDKPGEVQHLFIQGNVSLEVFPPKSETDTEAILKSIDQVDKLPAGAWGELAIMHDLPCEPLDRKLLRPVFMGLIQIAWHRAFRGEPTQRLLENQVKRVEAYKRDLEHLKVTGAASQTQARRSGAPRNLTPRAQRALRLTEDKAETWAKFGGQKGIIIAAMTAARAIPGENGITLPTLAAACRGKLNTKQPEERVIGFYFSAWIKEGIIEEVPEGTALATEVPAGWEPGEEPPKEEKPKTEPKKKASKKKAADAKAE